MTFKLLILLLVSASATNGDKFESAPKPQPELVPLKLRSNYVPASIKRINIQFELSELRVDIYRRTNNSVEAYLGAPSSIDELRRQVEAGKISVGQLSPALRRALDEK